jgi:hypothetical protein
MLGEFCFAMIGRADIEGSKSNVAMNAWLPQASYPCGEFTIHISKGKYPREPELLLLSAPSPIDSDLAKSGHSRDLRISTDRANLGADLAGGKAPAIESRRRPREASDFRPTE